MKHIISWSGGKDSTATVILAHEHNLPVDEIMFCEVMYDRIRGISGETPEHIDFVKNVAIPRFEEWGYKVRIIHAEKDYLDIYFHRKTKGTKVGKMAGYLLSGKCDANSGLKRAPIKKYKKETGECEEYLGIAIDEPERLARMKKKPNRRSLLAEYGMTEEDARKLCEKYGLLSPNYQMEKRQGCWFCPNAKIARFAHLKQTNPELYNEFITLGGGELRCSKRFNYKMTIEDLDRKVCEYIKAQESQITFDFEEKDDKR